MTLYEIRKLSKSELLRLKALIKLYEGYDKLDLLIEQVITPDYFTREEIKELKKTPEIKELVPQELLYCDGDKCVIDPTKMGRC